MPLRGGRSVGLPVLHFLLACLVATSCDAIGLHMSSLAAPARFELGLRDSSSLHPGWGPRRRVLIAKKVPESKPPSALENAIKFMSSKFDVTKVIDTFIGGLGLFAAISMLGVLEPRLGIKLFVPPMMASGIIFFAPNAPPDPFGFLSGTTAGVSICSFMLALLSPRLPAAVAAGGAAGALLVWYKSTNSIFPPAAVLSVLMAQSVAASSTATGVARWAASLNFVAAPWVAGHVLLYGSAMATSVVRQNVSMHLGLQKLRDVPAAKLRDVFKKYDISGDGELDAVELKVRPPPPLPSY